MLMGEGLGPCLMARSPGAHVIYATHSQTLADKVSIKARRKVAEHLAPVFSHLEPSPAKWTASWWETAGGNSFRAVGVGVGTAGEGANIAVEDDPFGSKEDAYSAREQERVLDHYLSDIETRIMRGGGVAIMHTRWHRGDLIGRLMEQQPGVWRVLSWPAIAEVDEPHRRAGEALVPHLFPLERLHHLRQILSQQHGGAMWEALYQQRPVAISGGMFKRHWFGTRYTEAPESIAARADEAWLSLDASGGKTGGANDFCALHVWARIGATSHLLDRCTRRMDATELDRVMATMIAHWQRWLTGVVVEDAALGSSYYQRHRGHVSGLVLFNPRKDTPGRDKGKEARALCMVGPAESGGILLPAPSVMPDVEELVNTWCDFPAAVHDDDVDAASQVFQRWQGRLNTDDWSNVQAAL